MTARIVLAGTGGEVTTAAARLAAATGAEVVALAVDLGGHTVRGGTVVDAVPEFAETCCLPAIQANALVTDLAWPVVGLRLAEAARQWGATTVAHGYEPSRFAAAMAAVAPGLRVLAVPGLAGPERTLWGHVSEPGDRWRFPADGEFLAPDEVVVTFDHGVPVAIDGETVSVAEALRRLTVRGEAQGVGRGDAFAAAGAQALVTAHRELEKATHEPELARFKRQVDREWATLVRDGGWFSPLKQALDSFVAEAQEAVSGEVRLVLHDGRVTAGDEPEWASHATAGRIVAPV